ncbi:hypothetical protein LUZ60_007100 [Juncus effusus]|nr:hypothetical protein LUZ60_007100 [Juncus effusus]
MSTTGRGWHSVLRIFKDRRGRTGHRVTCGALPAAGPYLRLIVLKHMVRLFIWRDVSREADVKLNSQKL